MMGLKKILSEREIKRIDLLTVEKNNLQSIDLMEQAAEAFVQYLMTQNIANQTIIVLCGPGNNGGDGLTGIIGSLIAQNYNSTEAACIGSSITD